jgi:predicted Zn-dependent protease
LETTQPSKLANFFQTHPMTSDRIAAATKAVQKDYPQASPQQPDPNAAQFEQMRQRLLKDVPAVR